MPYASNDDLPASVRDHLPERAQSIFREVFNHAHARYRDEATAFRIAWSAVKKQYVRVDGDWLPRVAARA